MTTTHRLKFTRSFWLRLTAVCIFVGLGTVAVIQSTKIGKHLRSAKQSEATEKDATDLGAETIDGSNQNPENSTTTAKQKKPELFSDTNNRSPRDSNRLQTDSSSNEKPTLGLPNPSPPTNQVANDAKSLPRGNAFAANLPGSEVDRGRDANSGFNLPQNGSQSDRGVPPTLPASASKFGSSESPANVNDRPMDHPVTISAPEMLKAETDQGNRGFNPQSTQSPTNSGGGNFSRFGNNENQEPPPLRSNFGQSNLTNNLDAKTSGDNLGDSDVAPRLEIAPIVVSGDQMRNDRQFENNDTRFSGSGSQNQSLRDSNSLIDDQKKQELGNDMAMNNAPTSNDLRTPPNFDARASLPPPTTANIVNDGHDRDRNEIVRDSLPAKSSDNFRDNLRSPSDNLENSQDPANAYNNRDFGQPVPDQTRPPNTTNELGLRSAPESGGNRGDFSRHQSAHDAPSIDRWGDDRGRPGSADRPLSNGTQTEYTQPFNRTSPDLNYNPGSNQNTVPNEERSNQQRASNSQSRSQLQFDANLNALDRSIESMQSPALVIEKLAPAEVQVNRPANFEVVVRNVGKATATMVQVVDEVPQGTELVSADPQPSSREGSKVVWQLGTIEPGKEQRIQMTLLPRQPGEIGSVAQVTMSTAAAVRTISTKPELSISAECPEQVLLGNDVPISIVVSNTGTGVAENVILQEDVPEGLEFETGIRQLEYPVGNLRPNESRTVQLRLKATRIGQIRNHLVAHAEGELRSTATVDVSIVAPKIVTSGSGPSTRFVNREVTHQFSIANVGSASAKNLEMTAQLPRGLKFKETNNKGVYNPQTHSITWGLVELKSHQTGKIELTTLPVEPGDQVIEFKVRADMDIAERTQQTLQVRQLSEVFFDIDDSVDVVEVGTKVSYEIVVINRGSIDATNVELVVDFPPGVRPITVANGRGDEIRGQQVVFPLISRLQPDQELKLTINAQGIQPGDHVVVARLKTEDRAVPVAKEASTHFYTD
ncbi:MAG TPA: hypothetical protein PKD64_13925 [Pirellulaceae bacterium]|nr:hypothetical protein [Pirellulaceae bacterium]HMO93285.1 hypothetical protein [Pirellulaceae bacterium]HMP70175.1 hypothetical protein [Pirellulaceae bacterium]